MDINEKIQKQKQRAIRNRHLRDGIKVVSFIFTIILAFANIKIFRNLAWGYSIGISILIGFVIHLIGEAILIKDKAQCPQCGNDWEIHELKGYNILHLEHCPDCKLEVEQKKENP